MTRFALVFAVVASLTLTACSPFDVLNATSSEDGYVKTEAVAYGAGERRKLDIYRPAGAEGALKTVVFFYGGSWKWGSRDDYAFAAEALASKGWLVVVPDYRLYPEVRFPGFIEDGARAVAWVKSNIADYGGDPDQLYLMGHSAGGHIALMLTLDEHFLADAGMSTRDIRATATLAAPAAFDPLKYKSVRAVFEQMPDPNQARPIEFVDGSEPPLLLLHGLDDDTVFPSNSENLTAAVQAAGGEVRYVTYPEKGHIGLVLALSSVLRDDAVLDEIAAFIAAH
ncbi:MAG: alpha/beta hydrolase [Alphaproteobacteria bacterium]